MNRFAAAIIAGMLSANPVHSAEHSLDIGGRSMTCMTPDGPAEILIDNTLESEGGSGGGQLIMNPAMLGRLSVVVQRFVFMHECGHLQTEDGGTELAADAFAIKTGKAEGWLTLDDIQDVCNSWDHAPAIPGDEHPSAQVRCEYLADQYTKTEGQ